jgi:amino acid adenylation domain-containing protein
MSDEDSTDIPGAVAVIGMAGRWPGADSVAQFWKNLEAGVESVARFSDAELEDNFSAEERAAPNFVKARPILENVGNFDAEFFGMYAREAELTDPQQRLFLECAWNALEDGGYDPAAYPGSIGVFAGASINTYFLNNVLAERGAVEGFVSNYQVGEYPKLLGAGADFLSTRVSYKLDLRGPSLTLSTACSTSLLAVAQACQSLLLYQADMALAGGVSITFPQKRGYQHLEGGMVAADGTCRPFDAAATGTIFGDGAGVVLLKRLEDALADGDHIYAVVRGAGINNDGAAKVGFTAPSVNGQAAVIEMAHANAGIEPRSVSYVECHGTATPLGDPIEIAGLTRAFAAGTPDLNFCAVGSVKGNVGHLDAAAGITGFIKTVLALEHRMLPASLHYQRPNPQIDFSKTPFFVNAELTSWPATPTPRRAGVSAFGVGGTNVHVVLEEAPARATRAAAPTADAASGDASVLVWSARSAAALDAARQNLAAHLRAQPALPLADVAFTLQAGRRAFDHRQAIVARDVPDAVAKLEAATRSPGAAPRRAGSGHVVFMFPGQGAQYPGMGRDLYEREPVFREAIERCAAILAPLMTDDLRALLYPTEVTPESNQRLMMTIAAQPAIFSVEYALASLWMSWGIKPDAMIGHSVGEFVAAVLAGVMSLADALAVVAARGRLMQSLPGGAMLAVRLPEAEVAPLLTAELSIAAINGPSLCVVAGPFGAVEKLEAELGARNVVTRRLHTSHAFHSSMIDPVIDPLRRQLSGLQLSAPTIPYVSCVTGDWIRAEEATSPEYWARHARAPVRFHDGILAASTPDAAILIEVGPGNALSTLATQATRGRALPVVSSMQDANRERHDRDVLLEAVARAWTHGASPAWSAITAQPHVRLPLPTYPFERSRHFIDAPRVTGQPAAAPAPDAPLTAAAPLPGAPTFNGPRIGAVAAQAVSPAPVMESLQMTIQDVSAMTQSSVNDRIASVSQAIAAIFEDLSGEKPASTDAETTFLEMGYDSLFLTQVAQKIQSQMKVKVTFRQLLGEFATIPALAKFLAEKLPAPAAPAAAPAAAAAPAVTAAAPAMAASSTSPAMASAPGLHTGIEGLFRDQLQAMSQLMNRQFEMLQGLGGLPLPAMAAPAAPPSPAAPVAHAPGAHAPVTHAPAAPQTAADVAAAAAVAAEAPAESSRFAVFMQGKGKNLDHAMTPEQRRHIDDLIARYTKKTAGSKAFTQAHRAVLADPRAAAGFRAEWKELVYPIVNTTSAGSKLYDVDGNEYIDILNGFGQTAFGHAPPFVTAAVKAQLDRGFAIGPQADMAGKVAQLFCEITGNDRMTFCNTGSEAVMAAMRLARTVTGREKIVIFNGDYHGQFDEVLVKGVQKSGAEPRSQPVAPGIPSTQVANMIVLEYGTPASLQWIRDNAEDLAAVIVEPVQSRHPHTRPFAFLREIRKITEASGTAFVMDEVVTGFRVHPGGMQAVLGIRADLATYGKVVGGGMPIGVLAGNTKFMDALDGGQWSFGDDSIPEVGVTFFAGTFVRHPLVLAAMWAVLNHIKDAGPALQETLAGKTAKLVGRLNQLFASRGVKTQIESYSSWFYLNFNNEHPLASLFYYHMRDRGIHIQESFPCFLTTAHSDSDFEKIYVAFEESLEAMQAVGILGTGRAAADAIAAQAGTSDAPAAKLSPGEVPLTESQLEIWLSAQLGEDASCAFNESVSLRMHGRLNRDALQKSLDRIVARHDALRATFTATGEAMRITAAKPFEYPHTDLSNRSPQDAEIAFAEVLTADARQPFDLVNGPCVRGNLVTLSKDSHAFVLTAHHIICDGWSINVIVNELAELYAAACRGEALELPDALPFSEYATAQAARDPADLAKTEAYWLGEFATRPATLELPTDRPRPTVKSFNGASLCRRIDAKLYQAVKKAGARQGSTLFVTLLAACQALMGRFAGQSEVVVGVPTAGQSLIEDRVLVGHCVNFLPIRGGWTQHTPVAEYLAATAKRVLDAYEHQSYTFGTLVRRLNLPREPGRLPLAEVQFNLERLADRIQLPDLTMDVVPNAKAFVNFDLFLNVIESAEGLRLDCDYNTDLFDASTVAHWLDCYQALLESIVADSAQPLGMASCIPAAERSLLLERMNATAAAYPRERSVHALIEAQAALTPDAVAAQFAEVSVSYAALERRANQMANVLRERFLGSQQTGRLIGVSVERSLDMLVALLAVMKAGCAYVPLDPMHPAARLRYILGEAKVAALISDGSENAALVPEGTPVLDVRRDAALIAGASVAAPSAAVSPDSLAYVIYTSGSTGKPKGVEISHRAVVNLLTSMARTPGLKSTDVFYAVTTISFDIAGLELFLPLITGAKVVIAERDAVIDGFRLLKNLATVGATAMQATPASWRLLLEAGFQAPPAFKMLCGGEALPRELANRLLQGAGELWNMYGPTETTIWSSCTRITAGAEPITVGGPIANTQFYILDRNDQPLPIGIPGELHIGGDGVARGYYQRDALTAEKFVPNPFTAGRMYRTGDLARWLPDGTLQVMGRIDHQVKLRGFRIELGEIEAVLTGKGNLAAAAVILREDVPGSARLVAYYVQKPETARTAEALRALLAEDMPEYMIPSAWVPLDALPLSPNGKLDRAALPVPDAALITKEEFVEPTTATEVALTKIFAEVLNMERVGATSDLLKLGADSIQLFQITARANRAGLKITARQLLQHRNAAALAAVADVGGEAHPVAEAKSSLPSLGQFKRSRRTG